MTKPTHGPALLALAALFGGGCEYFNTITVPAADGTAPTTGTRYLDNDGGDAIRFDGFLEVIDGDIGKNYFIAPFGFDSGGVQQIRISRGATRSCIDGDIGSLTHYHYFDQTQEGNQGIGQSAPNGRYEWFAFNPRDFVSPGDNCTVDMSWGVEATDYHGNTSYASGAIRYEP